MPAPITITAAQLATLQSETATLKAYLERVAGGPQPPSQAQLDLAVQYAYTLSALVRTIA